MKLPDMPKLGGLNMPKLGGLKMPNLGSQKSSAGEGESMLPGFAQDLYSDLRDRHLLPLAILLIVGIVAAPIVLASGSTPSAGLSSPSSATLSSEAALESQPAVLVSSPQLRDYKRRLQVFQEKNPFQQQLTHATVSSSQLSNLGAGVQSAITNVGASSSSSGSGSSSSSTPPPAAVSPTSSGTPPSNSLSGLASANNSGGGGATVTKTKTITKTVDRFFNYTVDLRFGLHGKAKRRDGVKTLALLPSDKTPVTAFLGITADGKSAAFLVSSNVRSIQGDGSCVPNDNECQFLTMKPGQSDLLLYDEDPADSVAPTNYTLDLLRINKTALKTP